MTIKKITDLNVGDCEILTRTITEADVVLYAGLIGDEGPLHLDEAFSARTPFGSRLSYGMLHSGYIGSSLARLLGQGSAYVSQNLRFKSPIFIGDTITIETEVTGVNLEKKRVYVKTTCTRNNELLAIDGEAELLIFEVKD